MPLRNKTMQPNNVLLLHVHPPMSQFYTVQLHCTVSDTSAFAVLITITIFWAELATTNMGRRLRFPTALRCMLMTFLSAIFYGRFAEKAVWHIFSFSVTHKNDKTHFSQKTKTRIIIFRFRFSVFVKS
jgi:hypothetical protein